MFYLRVAMRVEGTCIWQWKSTELASLQALTGFLRLYERVSKERIRIFFASTSALLKEMLRRENAGGLSNSLTMEQFRQVKGKIDTLEMLRFEMEVQEGGRLEEIARGFVGEKSETDTLDTLYACVITSGSEERSYDIPYAFALPASMREGLSWARLLTRVKYGVLVP